MWYLNMNAVMAIAGMVVILALTRWWPHNKRILLLAFNLCFLFVFNHRLMAFYLGYTALNYMAFWGLCYLPAGGSRRSSRSSRPMSPPSRRSASWGCRSIRRWIRRFSSGSSTTC
ncbi:hypothetical protein LJK88_00875 [Paenibacillus sp. P26]|nr:hypothetical protein LJK88_00875 [Paenibacillus sp. P26]